MVFTVPASGEEEAPAYTREQIGMVLNAIIMENILNGDDPEGEDDFHPSLTCDVDDDDSDQGSLFDSLANSSRSSLSIAVTSQSLS